MMTAQQRRCIECVVVCGVALFIELLVLPLFYKPLGEFSNSGRPGLAVTAVGAASCVWAFLRCPSRPLVGKIAVL